MKWLILALLLIATPAAADEPALADPATFTVCLQPLGKHDKKLLKPLVRGIEHLYGVTVKTLKQRALPEAAWYAKRKRYRADTILTFLDDEVAPDSGCGAVIGVTKVDVSATNGDIADWGVFGLGEIGGVSAVVSSFRLTRKASRKKLVMRIVKVANHELGHVLGLEHRTGDPDPACIMNDAGGTIKTVDAERGTLCAEERDALQARHGIALPDRTKMPWTWIVSGKGAH